MRKTLILAVILFSFVKMSACSCLIPKPILEFQSSEYVFEGRVISKTYTLDSLNYTIKFEILKHYKTSDNPKFLQFTFKSEGKYSGNYTSCDWNVNNNEKWLVYAYYWNNILTFEYNCSNSRPLNTHDISKYEQLVLDNANEFEIDNYIFTNSDGRFTNSKPKVDLDSILKIYSKKEYGKSYIENRADIVVDIDENGKLLSANFTSKEHVLPNYKTIDSIFKISKPPNVALRKPKTEFEKDILGIIKKITKWDITYIEGTNIPVKSRKFLQFHKAHDVIRVYY